MLENHVSPQADKPVAFQPMGFLDIVDGMFSIYRHHARLFFRLAALYFVLGFGVKIGAAFITNGDSSLLPNTAFKICGRFVVQVLIIGGLFFASAHCYLGNDISLSVVLRQALRRFWHHLGSGALWVIAAVGIWIVFILVGTVGTRFRSPEGLMASFAAAILIGIPFGAYFGIRWLFHTVLVLFEERSVWAALERSSELVEGTWWRVCGIAVAIYALGIAIQSILELTIGSILILTGVTEKTTFMEFLGQVFMDARSPAQIGLLAYVIQELISGATNAFVVPISSIGITLLYFDLRIRKEGFDIEMLARNK